MNHNKLVLNKAITLVELLLATALMGLVILTATNTEVALRRFYFTADKEGQLQVRLSTTMEHMVRNISLVHADTLNPGVTLITNGIEFRRDVRVGTPPNDRFTPQNYDDDNWLRYWLDGTQIKFCPDISAPNCTATNAEVIGKNIIFLEFHPVFTFPRSYVEVTLTGSVPGTPPSGPIQITLHTLVFPRSDSRN